MTTYRPTKRVCDICGTRPVQFGKMIETCPNGHTATPQATRFCTTCARPFSEGTRAHVLYCTECAPADLIAATRRAQADLAKHDPVPACCSAAGMHLTPCGCLCHSNGDTRRTER